MTNKLFVLVAINVVIYPLRIAALHSFQPNCTYPSTGTTYWLVSSPNVRGSWQLAWSCFFTIYVCAYQVIHLNIPSPSEEKKSPLSHLGTTLFWACVIIIAPEFILVDSWATLRKAQRDLQEVKSFIHGDQWTMTHIFYANMGGIVIRYSDKTILHIRGPMIREAIRYGFLEDEPPISAADILDKSKSNSFASVVAIGQIAFFCVQFFARIAQGLSVSQLELGVVSITSYSALSYLCLWSKPKGVEQPTIVTLSNTARDRLTLMMRSPANRDFYLRALQRIWPLGLAFQEIESDGNSSSTFRREKGGGMVYTIWLIFASLPLGIIHLSGWNLQFPTLPDLWLWRTSSIMATSFAPLLFWIGLNAAVLARSDLTIWFFTSCALLTFVAFFLARFILILECIRCLFFLPSDAFVNPRWTTSIPHFG